MGVGRRGTCTRTGFWYLSPFPPFGTRPLRILVVVMALGGLASCIPLPRYKSIDRNRDPYSVERLAGELDPWLLAAGFADALVVEIDWVEGCKPGPRTLAGFERILRRYVPADRISLKLDDEIPLDAWSDDHARNEVGPLIERFAGTVTLFERGVDKRYVLFVPEHRGYYGFSADWPLLDREVPVVVRGVVVARRPHERSAKLWLSRDRMERGTLIHEFGHQFGLVTNDRHERIRRNHRQHCTSLGCLMAHPTPRVIVRNAPGGLFNRFPRDYCRRCREDIRRAKNHWRRSLERDPGYLETIARQRAAGDSDLAIRGLMQAERYGSALDEIRRLRPRFPDYVDWSSHEARALIGLERYDEALALLLDNLPDDPSDGNYWGRRQLAARLLVGLGRHREAIDLFDRKLLREAGAYEVEQSAFVLTTALSGCGQESEAADLVTELLERGHPISYLRERMIRYKVDLLRRAGRIPEAATIVDRGLQDSQQRPSWLAAGRALREAQGQLPEARALLAETVDGTDRAYRAATEPHIRWTEGWRSVVLLAESGNTVTARRRAKELANAGEPDNISRPTRIMIQAAAWIALGEPDRAAKLVEALSPMDRGITDPCGNEALAPLRRSTTHTHLFAHCPPLHPPKASPRAPDRDNLSRKGTGTQRGWGNTSPVLSLRCPRNRGLVHVPNPSTGCTGGALHLLYVARQILPRIQFLGPLEQRQGLGVFRLRDQ